MIIQPIGPYCLTSMTPDFIFGSDVPITFSVKKGGATIMTEKYDPDSEDKIYVRDLGRVFESYLSGTLSDGVQASISGAFSLYVNTSLIETTTALLCRAYTEQAASVFFADKKPLHLQFGKKVTLPLAKEYLTFYLATEDLVQASVQYLNEGSVLESDLVTFYEAAATGFRTLEVTLRAVADLFPDISATSILSYKIGAGEIFTQFNVDWNVYADMKVFRYLNSFSVPASICTRGEVSRKRSHTYESSKINRVEKRFNLERTDTFKVEVGRKFSRTDELLLSEMTQSELVQVFFRGSFREIVITEEDSDEAQRLGSFGDSSFSFRFADRTLNTMLQDSVWVLENGTWEDWGSWFDDEHWND